MQCLGKLTSTNLWFIIPPLIAMAGNLFTICYVNNNTFGKKEPYLELWIVDLKDVVTNFLYTESLEKNANSFIV